MCRLGAPSLVGELRLRLRVQVQQPSVKVKVYCWFTQHALDPCATWPRSKPRPSAPRCSTWIQSDGSPVRAPPYGDPGYGTPTARLPPTGADTLRQEIACFSYDENHEFRLDDSSIRYYYPPRLPADLSAGFDAFRQLDDTADDHLDGLLRAIVELERRTGQQCEADVITWRGMMTKVLPSCKRLLCRIEASDVGRVSPESLPSRRRLLQRVHDRHTCTSFVPA